MSFSMEEFKRNYDTEIFPVKIDKLRLHFHKPKSIDRFINADDVMDGFPLWAKIWEASAVLMQYMANLAVTPGRKIIELGSGIGVAGIAAAALGHDITLTEYDPDALNFLRANKRENNCHHTPVQPLDWFKPKLEEKFDLIIGSELVYQESAIVALGQLFRNMLLPQGKVVLVERVRATGAAFFEKMASQYDIQARKHTLRSKKNAHNVVLFELSPK